MGGCTETREGQGKSPASWFWDMAVEEPPGEKTRRQDPQGLPMDWIFGVRRESGEEDSQCLMCRAADSAVSFRYREHQKGARLVWEDPKLDSRCAEL